MKTAIFFILLISIYLFPVTFSNLLFPNPFVVQQKAYELRTTRGLLLNTNLKLMNTQDGINKNEASIIAEYFFYNYAGIGCGGHRSPEDNGETWLVRTAYGGSGEPGPNILIDKQSGELKQGFFVLNDVKSMIYNTPPIYMDTLIKLHDDLFPNGQVN